MSKRKQKALTRSNRRRLGKYYTPDWVVDYIIQQTLGPTIQDHPTRPLGDFSVLDPACGDGAFLLGVFRFLVNEVKVRKKTTRQLILRSLVDTIHGVDIDPNAVTNSQKRLTTSARKQVGYPVHFTHRILLGNALIQDDDDARAVFGDDLDKHHPLVWSQVFPWVMRDGGFDVIVGNPPFIGVKSINAQEKAYIRRQFRTVYQQFDILVAFIEQSLRLLRPGGRLGFVISNKILAADYGARLRHLLISNYLIEQMVDLSKLDVFKGAATYPHILILRKPKHPDEIPTHETLVVSQPRYPRKLKKDLTSAIRVPQRYYAELPNNILTPALTPERFHILQHMQQNTIPLERVCTIRCGIAKTGFKKELLSRQQFEKLTKRKKKITRAFLNAGDIQRYKIRKRYFLTYSTKVSNPDQWQDFSEPKLLVAGMGKHLRVALDLDGFALGRVYYITEGRCPVDFYFLLALLNSQLINAYYTLLFSATHLRGGYIRYNASYLGNIPLPEPHNELTDEIAELAHQAHNKPSLLRKGLEEIIDHKVATLYALSPKDFHCFINRPAK